MKCLPHNSKASVRANNCLQFLDGRFDLSTGKGEKTKEIVLCKHLPFGWFTQQHETTHVLRNFIPGLLQTENRSAGEGSADLKDTIQVVQTTTDIRNGCPFLDGLNTCCHGRSVRRIFALVFLFTGKFFYVAFRN